MARFGFCGPTYSLTNLAANAQRCMNFYPEKDESGDGKSAFTLNGTPGLASFAAMPAVPLATFTFNGVVYAACADSNLYSVQSNGAHTQIASIPGTGPLTTPVMAANETQLVVVNGTRAYCYTFATGVTVEITSGSAGTPLAKSNPNFVYYADDYFIVSFANSPFFQISALGDGRSWNGTDVYQLSVFPDNLVGIFVDHREMWAFGIKATQPYFNSGAASNPWVPIGTGYIEEGLWAPNSIAKMDNSLFWLGGSDRGRLVARRAQGYTPTRVSNHAIEAEWQSYSVSSDAISYTYQENGHEFWVLYFPTVSKTWVYDASTGLWHERGYWDTQTASYVAHHSRNHVFCYGKHLVGDWSSANIYELSETAYDDAGNMIRRLRDAPYITSQGRWLRFNTLEIEMETGLGLNSGQGSDPQITIRWSNDRGQTWSNDHTVSAGKMGEYGLRVLLRRLGRCWGTAGRIFEMIVTDPIPWRFVDAYINGSPDLPPSERIVKQAEKVA